jgi:PBSX family phage terminase large subunit
MNAAVAVRNDVLLFPLQHQFVTDPARFPGYVGGIGSGKSFAGAVKAITRLTRPGLGLVAAPTYSMLRDATQRTLFALMERVGIEYDFRKGENALTVLRSGHEIIFRSLDDAEKVRGPNLDWAWVDEASLVERMAWSIVKGRVRVGAAPQAWATFTPKGRNWCWEEWERDADVDHPLYRARTDENPELPPGFAAALGYTGNFAAQELGGEFVAFEGVVYPMFSRPIHVRRVDCDGWRSILGVDIGTRNPTAILTVRGEPERRHVEREVYRPGMSSEEIVAAIEQEADRTTPEKIFLDPSAAAYIETLQRHGYPAEKAVNEVKFGIGEVSSALAAADGLTIDPSCVNLIAELESYHYPANKTDSDAPVKEFDHACDALRYAIASEANVVVPRIWV